MPELSTDPRTFYAQRGPITGLHFADVRKLPDVLHRLVGAGNAAVVIEHNLDVIVTADWMLDLGPEGARREEPSSPKGRRKPWRGSKGAMRGSFCARRWAP